MPICWQEGRGGDKEEKRSSLNQISSESNCLELTITVDIQLDLITDNC